jgi:hypothetical protein
LSARPGLPGEEGEMSDDVDMTNNRVPYGLLTDEEKAALYEHEKVGGVIEYCAASRSVFEPATNLYFWVHHYIYRTVPLPKTQDVIAWEKLPDWVEWVARDKRGEIYCGDVEPVVNDTHDVWVLNMSRNFRRIDDFPGIVVQIGTCDWTESKQRRPRG